MIAIVDYGVGNLFSLKASLRCVGADACVTSDAEVLARAERLLLPGVGAFGDAADRLRATGLAGVVRDQASVWECSCCLTRAWNTESIRGWD